MYCRCWPLTVVVYVLPLLSDKGFPHPDETLVVDGVGLLDVDDVTVTELLDVRDEAVVTKVVVVEDVLVVVVVLD